MVEMVTCYSSSNHVYGQRGTSCLHPSTSFNWLDSWHFLL